MHDFRSPPSPEDFGINAWEMEEIPRALREAEERAGWRILAATSGVLFCYLTGALIAGEFLAALCFLLVVAPITLVVSGLIGVAVLSLSADYRYNRSLLSRLERYRSAISQHEEELNRLEIQFWQSLTPTEFEHEVAAVFTRLGMTATVTKSSGDGGIDIHVYDGYQRAIVQCKRYGKNVGPAVVRELFGCLIASKANLAILVCTGGFTSGVQKFAEDKAIALVDLARLIDLAAKGASRTHSLRLQELLGLR